MIQPKMVNSLANRNIGFEMYVLKIECDQFYSEFCNYLK